MIGDDGRDLFASPSCREASSRLANGLRGLGRAARRPAADELGNVAPLWVAMLAAMKLGLVVIPAPPQLARADIDDRSRAGGRSFVIAEAADAGEIRRRAATT